MMLLVFISHVIKLCLALSVTYVVWHGLDEMAQVHCVEVLWSLNILISLMVVVCVAWQVMAQTLL